jgi:quinol monooxygenase YgiN
MTSGRTESEQTRFSRSPPEVIVPVIMVLRLKCDPDALERFASANTELMDGLSAAARRLGSARHAFAAGDGEVIVIDEWPDEAAFQEFFDSQPDVHRIMEAAGAQGPPEVTFYRRLDTPGQF